MKRHPFVVVLVVGTLIAGTSLAYYLHQQVKAEVVLQFRESQLQIARQAAAQIESYVGARIQDLRRVALRTSLQQVDLDAISADVQARLARLKAEHVDEVSLVNAAGTIVYSTNAAAIGSDARAVPGYVWAQDPATNEAVRVAMESAVSTLQHPTGGAAPLRPRLVISTPLYEASAFAGILFLKIDLQALAEDTIMLAPTNSKTPAVSIWAMDADGTVLLQSEHPEMMSRNIRSHSESCRRCHVSFDYAERMLTARQGAADYELNGRPVKLAAFAPVTLLPNVSWIVVVSSPEDAVTGFIQTNFRETLALVGIVGLVLAVAFVFINRSARQETIIVEEARHLREKERLVDELREAREYLENLFDSASAPILVCDAELHITRFNRACERLTGRAAFDAIGADVRTLFLENEREASLMRLLAAADDHLQDPPEVQIRRADGEVRTVLWNAAHIRVGEDAAVLATIAQGQDITERKRAEERLHAADEQLREQAALVRLGEMAAVVAHEVKNPLAGIRGTIEVIRGRLTDSNSREAAIMQDVIARIDALDELMKDLLLFARPPQMHPAPVDLVALAKETTALVSQDPAARDVQFEVDGAAPLVIGDAKLLKIVFLNLMVNATHALRNSGTIRASVTADDRTCQIAIADTGPGIPAEIRDRIFVPFFTTKARGTGLGLSTAKRLVDAHHGSIRVECPPGGGTVVAVELPRAPTCAA